MKRKLALFVVVAVIAFSLIYLLRPSWFEGEGSYQLDKEPLEVVNYVESSPVFADFENKEKDKMLYRFEVTLSEDESTKYRLTYFNGQEEITFLYPYPRYQHNINVTVNLDSDIIYAEERMIDVENLKKAGKFLIKLKEELKCQEGYEIIYKLGFFAGTCLEPNRFIEMEPDQL